MGNIAFTLRDQFAGSVTQFADDNDEVGTEVPVFSGGVIAVGESSDVNIRDLLDEGDGVIVVDEGNLELLEALDQYPALKRTTVPDGAPVSGSYDGQTAAVLKDELKRRGITGAGASSKPDLIAALRRIDELAGQGENVAADTSITDLMAQADEAGDEGEPGA